MLERIGNRWITRRVFGTDAAVPEKGETHWGLDYLLDQIVPKTSRFDPAEFADAKRQHDALTPENGGYNTL